MITRAALKTSHAGIRPGIEVRWRLDILSESLEGELTLRRLLDSPLSLPAVWLLALLAVFSPRLAATAPSAAPAEGVPNFLVVLVDDLGYSDLGCYGGEIDTPNLDQLAANGLRFSQFYNTARCWPTRAAILTGFYAQQVRRDRVPGLPSGGRGKRPAWAPLLPRILNAAGYRAYHSGKWHLDGMPIGEGFDRSYYLRDQGRFFHPRAHFEDDKKLAAVESGSDYYGTTAIADHAVRCLEEHAEKHAGKPFFHYLAFTAPHFPLHALPEDIAKYRERYRRGWDIVRAARVEKQRTIDLLSCEVSKVERDVGPPYGFPKALETLGSGEVNRPVPWSDLTDEQRDFQATKMAIHAAMVDRIDRELGRVLEQLRAMEEFEDTVIFFLSDNGASAEIMVRDDGHDPSAPPGSAATYLCLGPGWSTVANTPFRRHKTWVHEGGTATPFIVHWPKGIRDRGVVRGQVGHVVDVVPTICDLAGVDVDRVVPGRPRGEAPGVSLRDVLSASAKASTPRARELWWLHEGHRAIRVGDWKLVAAKGDAWELFDLASDRAETRNLAGQQPQRVEELARAWETKWERIQELAGRDLAAPVPAPRESGAKPVKKILLPGESFLIAGRPAFVLLPPEAKRVKPQPWILYAPTLPGLPDRHETWMHEQFLAAGVAVAGIDAGDVHGSPKSQELFSKLHEELTTRRGFAPRPCLLGRSRGGLFVSAWAIARPKDVAGIAGIYPVFDLRSYPGLQRAAPAYGLSLADLERNLAKYNPIARAAVLAEARVPVYLLHGDRDEVVPLPANSGALANVYAEAGVAELVELEVAEGQGHNYWPGFFRSRKLIEFAIARAKEGRTRP